jgi:hypothetical protein
MQDPVAKRSSATLFPRRVGRRRLRVGFPIIGIVMGFMGAGLASLTGPRSADRGRLTDVEALA